MSLAMSRAMSDHDNMNAEMFMNWVQHRLAPTFNAVFGPGTELGGVDGKKMICIMVCTKVPLFILYNSLSFSLAGQRAIPS